MPVYTDSVTGYLVTDIDNRIDIFGNMISWSLKTSINTVYVYSYVTTRNITQRYSVHSVQWIPRYLAAVLGVHR
jgi:hypothetical protein